MKLGIYLRIQTWAPTLQELIRASPKSSSISLNILQSPNIHTNIYNGAYDTSTDAIREKLLTCTPAGIKHYAQYEEKYRRRSYDPPIRKLPS